MFYKKVKNNSSIFYQMYSFILKNKKIKCFFNIEYSLHAS